MELGRFKTRIENDSWEAAGSTGSRHDLLFQDIKIENDKIKGTLKMQEGDEAVEKYFSIYKRGESFIIKSDFFISAEELGIKFVNHDLLIFDKEKKGIEITIYNKEAYN